MSKDELKECLKCSRKLFFLESFLLCVFSLVAASFGQFEILSSLITVFASYFVLLVISFVINFLRCLFFENELHFEFFQFVIGLLFIWFYPQIPVLKNMSTNDDVLVFKAIAVGVTSFTKLSLFIRKIEDKICDHSVRINKKAG